MAACARKKRGWLRWLLIAALLLAAAVIAMEQNLSQTLLDMAFARAYSMAVETINRAVKQVMEQGVTYEELIDAQMDAEGRVSMLRANTMRMNELASQTALLAERELGSAENQFVEIPLGAALGIDVCRAAYTRQVHGREVRVVTMADAVAPETHSDVDCDAVVTAECGLPLFCFTADCVPVLLYDGVHGTAGAVHCGWRSSVADIIGAAVEAMCSLGSRPEDISAAMGAAIGTANFETDGDVPEAMRAWLGHDAEEFIFTGRREGKYYVDLRGALAHRLCVLGLRPENIAVSRECTVELHDKYWSHRYTSKHGLQRGSQCAVIEI